MNRVLKIKSIHNIRDLGGLVNKEGKTIKRSLLIRSGSLDKVKNKDINILKNKYNLKIIIDLRNNQEINDHPDLYTNEFNYLKYAILQDTKLGITREEKNNLKDYVHLFPQMDEMYKDIINDEKGKESIYQTLNTIINNRDGAVLWHCSAGKDRCGMISAFILYLLDVDEKIILEDYLYSNKDAIKVAYKYYFLVFLLTRSFKIAKRVYDLFIVDEKYYMAAINEINKKYNSVKDYLYAEIKINKKDVDKFKEYILDEK